PGNPRRETHARFEALGPPSRATEAPAPPSLRGSTRAAPSPEATTRPADPSTRRNGYGRSGTPADRNQEQSKGGPRKRCIPRRPPPAKEPRLALFSHACPE